MTQITEQTVVDLCNALDSAASMLGSVAGDIEDGYSLGDIRGKYVLCLLGARDRARDAIKKAREALK